MKKKLLSAPLALLLSSLSQGEAPLFDFLPVHPQSDALVDTFPRDAKGVPTLPDSAAWSDYLIVPFTPRDAKTGKALLDAEGKPVIDYFIVTKPEVLRARGLYVSSEDIAEAQRDRSHGAAAILLTEQGGERMKALTANMRMGIDCLTIRVRGGVVSAPMVHETLSRHVQISGLSPLEMAQMLNKSGEKITRRDAYIAELRARDLSPLSPMSDEDHSLIERACEASKPYGVDAQEFFLNTTSAEEDAADKSGKSSTLPALIALLEAQPDTLTDEQLALRLDLGKQLATDEKLLYHKEKNILASSSSTAPSFIGKVDGEYITMHPLTLIRERDGRLMIERYKVPAAAPLPSAWKQRKNADFL